MSDESATPRTDADPIDGKFDGMVRSDNHFTPDEYRRILERTARIPGIDAALAEGDVVHRAFLESVKKGELRSSPGTESAADGERGV